MSRHSRDDEVPDRSGDHDDDQGRGRTRVKICGLTRPDDATVAAEAGAGLVGAVLVPDSPRAISAREARAIGEAAGVPLVVVVADLEPVALAEFATEAGASVIQFHGDESEDDLFALRELGGWELWKALRVRSGNEILPAAHRWAEAADGLLLDGWHPGQLGGTGTRFPWEALEEIRSVWPDSLALIAAGGLTSDNVADAVRRLHPHVVDVSSGVERSPGIKDPTRIREFLAAVATA